MTTSSSAAAWRLVALVCMLTVVALWLQHHWGFRFTDLGVYAGLTVVLAVVGKAVENLVSKRAARQVGRQARRPLRAVTGFLSRPSVLAVMAAVFVVLLTTMTSLTVTAEQTLNARTMVSIVALDSPHRLREDSLAFDRPLVRFFVLANPFGRPFRVHVKGFLPTTTVVYPLISRQLIISRDLTPAPSVLFRPLVEGTSALRDRGVFRVSRITPDGLELLSADTGFASSFRLGEPRPITASVTELWRLQLDAFGAPAPERARMLLLWNAPRQLRWAGDLTPGDSLLVEILRHDRVVARARLAVSPEALMDVMVMDLTVPDSDRDPAATREEH